MIRRLQHVFALSEKGAKDFVKAVIWCFLCNISLMLPVGVVMAVIQYLLGTLEAEGTAGSVHSPLFSVRGPVSGYLQRERVPQGQPCGNTPEAALKFFRKPGSERPDGYDDCRLLQS